jgi:Ca2+-binding EF-hand superfamily protein
MLFYRGQRSGLAISIPLARRKLARTFENFDLGSTGYVTRDDMILALSKIGVTYGTSN